jgi:gluconokinase
MGVSGCDKTTVGKALAQHLEWDFFDADDFHLPANIAKKEQYRQQLTNGNNGAQLVYLKGSYDLIWSRMSARWSLHKTIHVAKSIQCFGRTL